MWFWFLSCLKTQFENTKLIFLKFADIDETSKGCCGTGTIEYGDSCKGLSTCTDPTKYVFWDAVHPTEKMYKIIADEALKSLSVELLS